MDEKFSFTSNKWFEEKVKGNKPLMSYGINPDFDAWRGNVKSKIESLLGDMPSHEKFEVIPSTVETNNIFKTFGFTIRTEDDAFPCKLVVPDGAEKSPLLICIQGHTTGMHMSLGMIENETDKALLKDNMDFAVQAVENGFSALLVEMRFMGERQFDASKGKDIISCYRPTMGALLCGKTTIGLRVADLRAVVSALPCILPPEVKADKIILLGHSGGGTAAFFTACLDDRIDGIIVSCALCDFAYSILHTEHCSCNYVPGMFKYLDMADMAAAVFPRPIISLGGRADDIFLFEGIERTFRKIDAMYAENGAKGRCVLIEGEGGHMFFKDKAWDEIRKLYA